MKISIITWDASFRESFHTVESFGNQDFRKEDFEFIWCDFYSNENELLKKNISKYDNFKLLNMNNNRDSNWHLGTILNHGIKEAKGEILIIPDGDIIVHSNFLKEVEQLFSSKCSDNTVCYYRRWDEPKQAHSTKSYTIDYLSKHCKLNNLTNYGGCFAIKRETFKEINYYEEHRIFSGPGANGLEQYRRFRNKGLQIMWSHVPVYHPYHDFTGSSDKITRRLKIAANYNPWINPYNGLEQSWVLHMRDKNLDWKANDGSIDDYLERLESINYFLFPPRLRSLYIQIKRRIT